MHTRSTHTLFAFKLRCCLHVPVGGMCSVRCDSFTGLTKKDVRRKLFQFHFLNVLISLLKE